MAEVEITARRMVRFNTGRYEEVITEVTITGISQDVDPEDISIQLDLLMAPEVERAEKVTTHHPDDDATSVYTWREITDKAKEGVHA